MINEDTNDLQKAFFVFVIYHFSFSRLCELASKQIKTPDDCRPGLCFRLKGNQL